MNKEKKEVVKVNQITEGVIWQQILIFFLPISNSFTTRQMP